MPRVGFYNPYIGAGGGGEKYFLTILEVAARHSGAEIVLLGPNQPDYASWERLGVHVDPSRVAWRAARPPGVTLMTRGLDLLIAVHNHIPPLSLARRSVAIIQFPSRRPRPRHTLGGLADRLRLASYDTWVCYSHFVEGHLRERLGVDPVVIPPPIDVKSASTPRAKLPEILAVGRFFQPGETWNAKKHDVLIRAFRRLRDDRQHRHWSLHLAGECDNSHSTMRYIRELESAAAGLPVNFHLNASRDDLEELYGHASLFWHAAGLGETMPDRQEHFGMTTVEAMASGCVPIVPALGGQLEIVHDGYDGCLYRTPEELVERTARLIAQRAELDALASAARRAARRFSADRFVAAANEEILSPTLTDS